MQLNLFDFQEENKKQDSNKRIVSNLDLDDVLKNLNPNLYRKDVYFERFEFDITWPTKGRWLLTVGEIAIRNTKLPYRSDYVWMNFDLADGTTVNACRVGLWKCFFDNGQIHWTLDYGNGKYGCKKQKFPSFREDGTVISWSV